MTHIPDHASNIVNKTNDMYQLKLHSLGNIFCNGATVSSKYQNYKEAVGGIPVKPAEQTCITPLSTSFSTLQ
jgi:hypothetical protein